MGLLDSLGGRRRRKVAISQRRGAVVEDVDAAQSWRRYRDTGAVLGAAAVGRIGQHLGSGQRE
jgi:hypothetical protein